MTRKSATTTDGVYVWDWPTRAFHWLLAASIAAAYASAEWLGDLESHMRIGQFVFGLIVFRIVWGFIGGRHARFSGFLREPIAVLAYARRLATGRDWRPHAGHNPLGGWAAVALLSAAFAQAATGLMTTDDIFTDGPLVGVVPYAWSQQASSIHHIAVDVLVGLIALHLSAIAFYAVARKTNLVGPMATGLNRALDAGDAVCDARARPLPLAIAVGCGVAAVAAVNLAR